MPIAEFKSSLEFAEETAQKTREISFKKTSVLTEIKTGHILIKNQEPYSFSQHT
jgi:hypothetical protein